MMLSTRNYSKLGLLCLRMFRGKRCYSTVERFTAHMVRPTKFEDDIKKKVKDVPDDFRFAYTDFFPDPLYDRRNLLREKIEREDMIARRYVMDIPEFYVGSIVSVTLSDPNAAGKINKFTGICIARADAGLKSNFTLRNIVDHIGVEIMYELYCPLILSIDTLRLEKRLDDHLHYLRDCLPEYSTVPMDMEAEPLIDGASVPVNDIKVEFRPLPWHRKWWSHGLKGVNYPKLTTWHEMHTKKTSTPWEKYDLMKEYKLSISEEEQAKIYHELLPHLPKLDAARRRVKKLRATKSMLKSS